MKTTTQDQPTERRRAARLREHRRNQTDAISEGLKSNLVERAAQRLPRYKDDVHFRVLLHRICAAADDEIPDELLPRYLARRSEVAWLEDGVEVQGTIPDSGITAVARLAVATRDYHRRLMQLVKENP